MDVLIGLAVTLMVIVLLVKFLQFLFRLMTAPFRKESAPRTPRHEITVTFEDFEPRRYSVAESRRYGKLTRSPADCWVPKGREVSIAGRSIPGGLIYVGQRLSGGRDGTELEAALINPKLRVGNATQCGSNDMSYWPSYDSISAACRGRHLDWLAGGRRDPDVDIGFVFLFFYGLERRMLIDPSMVKVPAEEKRAIRAEVARLLSIYSGSGSFSRYAGAFMDFTEVLLREAPLYESAPPKAGPPAELPASVRVAIAELARDGLPVPREWAFSWVLLDPETSVRTPARRCKEEVEALFLARYRAEFGEGMRVKPNKRTVKLEYQPASPSIGSVPSPSLNDLPDVTSLKAPIRKLMTLFDACVNDLDAYSRWLGRNPEARGSLQALALLPQELVSPENMGDSARALNALQDVGACMDIPSESILEHWPPGSAGKYRKADAVALAQFLEKLGYGMEPDVRFNGPRPDSVDHVTVFRLGKDAPSAPTRDYLSACLTLRLAAAVAVADGIVTDDEQRSLESQLESSSALRPGDRDRLRAHLQWLLVERPKLSGLKQKLSELKPSMRALLGQILLAIAAADGEIDPTEIKTIRKLYGQLGLDPEAVYSDLHALALKEDGAASGPVTVRDEDQPKGFKISAPDAPTDPAQVPSRVVLDPRLVEAKRREAQQATALLSSIFVEDEAGGADSGEAITSAAPIASLDGPHSVLLTRLAQKQEWAMEEIEAMTSDAGLLAEGALETINEAAWDSTGSPVFDIGDTVSIDQAVLGEFLA